MRRTVAVLWAAIVCAGMAIIVLARHLHDAYQVLSRSRAY